MKQITFFYLACLGLGCGIGCCSNVWAQGSNVDQNDNQQIDGEISVGVGLLSDDSYRYGRYTGVVDQGAAPLFHLHLNSRPQWNSDDARYAWLDIDYFGVNRVQAHGEIGVSGDQKIKLDFRKIANFLYDDASTVFSGSNSLTLPGTWQATGSNTQGMPNLNAALMPAKIDQQRDSWQLNYRKQLPLDNSFSAWDVKVDYRHDDKSGRRLAAGTIGTNGGNARSALLIAPLDFETDIFGARFGYSATRSHLAMGYEASWFRNGNPTLQWENPFGQDLRWAAAVGFPDGQGQLAQEPDNEMQRLFLSGGFRFARTGNAQFDLSRARMTQEEDFLPYTINPNLAVTTPLLRNNLNGDIEATNFTGRISLSPLSKLNLSANFRFNDRENSTPRDLYLPVAGDAEDQTAAVEGFLNRPYSNTKKDFNLKAKYRLSRGVRLNTAYQHVAIDRDYSQVENSVEQSVTAGIRLTRLSQLSLSADVTLANRDSDSYQGNLPLIRAHLPGTVAADEFEDHPLLRKYFLSDRDRNSAKVRADWFPRGDFNVGMSASYNRDQYDNDFFGLNESTNNSLALDLGFTLSEHAQLSGFISRDQYNNDQSSRGFTATPGQAFDPTRNWFVSSDDDFTNIGFNADWRELQQRWALLRKIGFSRRLDIGLELLYSRSRGEIDTQTGPALSASPLPDLSTQLQAAKIYLKYNLSADTTLDFVIQHESYRSDDFALDNVSNDTMANVLSLGDSSPQYSINWVSCSYSISF